MSAQLPGVSYVMPVLNEAAYLELAVSSILAQRYPGPTEILLALGPSTDETSAVARRLERNDPRIRLVHNPRAHIPVGMNLAIAASRHPIIVRVDAHTELPEGYTERAVRTLQREGAATVGGVMAARGRAGVQAAIARAYNSRFGLGGGAYHSEGVPAGPAESAYLGVSRVEAITEAGGYDETLLRGEDWELNYRLRQRGELVWLDPQLRVTYWPRGSFGDLARQFLATGTWRGELVRRLRAGNSPRFFAPPVLVGATAVSVVLLPLAGAGVLAGPGLAVAVAVAGVPAAYAGFLAVAAASGEGDAADRLRYVGALATMHYCWGVGFLRGLVFGARGAVDTSRTGQLTQRA